MRLFLALQTPDSLRAELAELRERLAPVLQGWRWIRDESIHLTLRFLGEVPAELDQRSRPAWRRVAAAAPALRIRLEGVGRFPPRGAPRVLWVGVEELDRPASLAGLAQAFEQAACELGWPAERRPFRPHLTLARRRAGARPSGSVPVESVAGQPARVERVELFRSRLGPAGARYTLLESFPLGAAPGEAGERGG